MLKKMMLVVAVAPLCYPLSAMALDLSMLKGMHVAIGGGGGLPARKFKLADINGALKQEKVKQGSLRFYNFEIGRQFGDFRGGLEILQTTKANFQPIPNSTTTITGKLRSTALLFNANFDLDSDSSLFKPYVGFGLGLSRNKLQNILYKFPASSATWDAAASSATAIEERVKQRKAFKFAWKLNAGTHLKLRDNVFLNFSYNYVNFGKVRGRLIITSSSGASVTNNAFKGLERGYHLFNAQIVYRL